MTRGQVLGMTGKRKKSAARAMRGEVRLRGKPLPSMDREIVLLRVGKSMRPLKSTKPSDSAEVMVPKLSKALRKPGISKQTVFRGRSPERIFAYSVLPRDVTKIVREAADGTRTVGRAVGGKFRAE